MKITVHDLLRNLFLCLILGLEQFPAVPVLLLVVVSVLGGLAEFAVAAAGGLGRGLLGFVALIAGQLGSVTNYQG